MKILVGSWPGYGHLLPMVPMIRAAQRGGHDVVVTSGSDLAGLVENLGVTAHRSGLTLAESYAPPARGRDGQRAAAGGAAVVRGAEPLRRRRGRPGPRRAGPDGHLATRPGGARHAGARLGNRRGRARDPAGHPRLRPDGPGHDVLRGGHRVRDRRGRAAGPGRRGAGRAVPGHLPAEPGRCRAEPVAVDAPAAPGRRGGRPGRAGPARPVGAAAPGHGLRHPRHRS